MEIVRWTTPSITYKPSAVTASDIDKIFLVISQNGGAVITKAKDDALINEGTFMWTLTQAETGMLNNKLQIAMKIDYLTNAGKRYAVRPKVFIVSDSAVNEVIS